MTPVFAAIPVETLIWITLLLIGAVGSIASNARKAATASKAQPRPQPQAQPQPPTRREQVRDQIREQFAARLSDALQERVFAAVPPPPPAPAPTPPAPKPAPPSPAPVPAVAPHPVPAPHGTTAFRGMFERGNLVRAIVAAEVLGPPKSLREQ
jgi:hypothetical protein